VNRGAKVPEDDWKKKWKPGTYDYSDPEYEPGTHEIERGDVTWHQLRETGNAVDSGEDSTGQDRALREEGAE
jgi:hypothetical protein